MNDEKIDAAPDYALDLYPNKALVFDPNMIGQNDWPNKATLPADLNLDFTNYIYELMGDADFAPAHKILHSLFYITGVLSFNLSFYNLAQTDMDGLVKDSSKLLVSEGETSQTEKSSSVLKDYVATKGQKTLLRLTHLFNVRLKLTTLTNTSIYDPEEFKNIVRIRRPQAMLNVEKTRLKHDEQASLKKLIEALNDKVISLALTQNIQLDKNTAKALKGYVTGELTRTYHDLKAVQSFFGATKFTFFERSLTPYIQSLISTVCRQNNGQAYSSYHGVCQTASEPDVATMANASVFWGVTKAFSDDAQELAQKIPESIRTFTIENLSHENHFQSFIKNDRPREQIKHVAIMGRHVVMRTSAFNTLEFPAYLDIERKMSALLVENGYEVTYKAHPESTWEHFDRYFDPRVKIDWRPFEGVMDEFDALYYHFGASSTLPHALGSHLHVFMLQDGWHDVRIWPSRIQKFYQRYCNMLPGAIGPDGLIDFDEEKILAAFKKPVSFDKDKRIHDFFCKREF